MDQVLLWAAALFAAGACAAAIVAAVMAAKYRRREEGLGPMREELDRLRGVLIEESRQSRQESAQNITRSVNALGQALASNQQQMSRELGMRQDSLQKTVAELMRSVDARFQSFTTQSGEQLSGIRTTVENRLSSLQEDNAKKLEEMRKTVDEKLEQTLESRIGQSFKLVSERLEQVYKGLGEKMCIRDSTRSVVRMNLEINRLVGSNGGILRKVIAVAIHKPVDRVIRTIGFGSAINIIWVYGSDNRLVRGGRDNAQREHARGGQNDRQQFFHNWLPPLFLNQFYRGRSPNAPC